MTEEDPPDSLRKVILIFLTPAALAQDFNGNSTKML